DTEESPAIRKRIPKTLAFTGKQQAADALIQQLHHLDYHLDYAVLRALNRMRVNSPSLVIDPFSINTAMGKERDEYLRFRTIQSSLEANATNHPLVSLLIRAIDERLQHRLERIFRLVGLTYSPHDIYSIYYNCKIKPALRPAAIEFLDNLLDAQLKET